MSIDRTNYNALVNDDGSNTTGTPWTKAIVASVVLDPIDAAIDAGAAAVRTVATGGTGLASYAIGDLIYAGGTTALSKRAAVAVGQVLVSAGVATAPVWSANPTLGNVTVASLSVTGGGFLFQANELIADTDAVFDIGRALTYRPRNLFLAGNVVQGSGAYWEGLEMTAPAAPPANSGRVFFEDSAGKTRLVVRFPTGAVQQIAIEP